jgi:hypothetical protein
MGISTHEKPNQGETDVWLTPPWIIDTLGPFDLDPCAATNPPWATATTMFTESDNGLAQPWHGFVWCNPPYSDAWTWLERLADHGTGIALIFARTETKGFQEQVWGRASGVLFLAGRLKFHRFDGSLPKQNAGAPSCLVAYGPEAVERLARIEGPLVTGWRN